MRTYSFTLITFILVLCFMMSCSSHKPLSTVDALDKEKYLGTWYEIQRFPHSFEKDLQCVSATYSLRDDGDIKVLNRGFNGEKWKDIEGKAWTPNLKKPGELKVQFFWPFSGDYFIIEVDTQKYALVGTPNRDYLWILARDKSLDDATLTKLREKAHALGFDVTLLNEVSHHCAE